MRQCSKRVGHEGKSSGRFRRTLRSRQGPGRSREHYAELQNDWRLLFLTIVLHILQFLCSLPSQILFTVAKTAVHTVEMRPWGFAPPSPPTVRQQAPAQGLGHTHECCRRSGPRDQARVPLLESLPQPRGSDLQSSQGFSLQWSHADWKKEKYEKDH